MEQALLVSSYILPLLIAITMHEAAHGFVAYACGDNTAKRAGRVTLNPISHMEAFGTFILPGILYLSQAPFLFGWAKPVPVDFSQLRRPRRDMLLVAAAGPITNLLLAFISALALHLDPAVTTPEDAPWLFLNIYHSITINIILAAFNMLPILPLDGGRILNSLLPRGIAAAHARTERYGMLVILLLFMVPGFLHDKGIMNLNPGYYLIYLPADWMRDGVLHAAGIANS